MAIGVVLYNWRTCLEVMGPEREGAGVGKVMGIWAIMEQALCISFASVHRAI